MILNHPNLSSTEVKLLISAADKVYQDQTSLDGWNVITPDLTNQNYGLDPQLITGNTFKAEGLSVANGNLGDANAAVYKSGNSILLAFRGTEIPQGDAVYWFALEQHYDLFEPLFQALDNYIQVNPTSKILVTGHSLGAAMAEFYMAEHPGSLYSAVTVASPVASYDSTDTRILNIGYENDLVYEIRSQGLAVGASPNNATTDFYISIGVEHQVGTPPYEHQMRNYIYGTQRVFDSNYYSQMERDSSIVVELTDSPFNVASLNNISDPDAFVLGENDDRDYLNGSRGNDVLEGLGDNDTLIGDNFDVSWLAGNDTLDGGEGDDILDGGSGNPFGTSFANDLDVAVFSNIRDNYDISFDSNTEKFIVTDNVGTDGTDTLTNIELAEFADGTGALKDGSFNIQTDEAPSTSTNFFDPGIPIQLGLTMPVSMIDGDAEYTVNISPFETNPQYNIAFIIDTSDSMNVDPTEFQNVKDAYTNLINYFKNNDIADDTNFGVVSFSKNATLYADLTADEAINTIQGLTTASPIEGTHTKSINVGDR